jgi:hypothetical protein
MLATVVVHCCRQACTSERCPACNAPIVGTKPIVFFCSRDSCNSCRISETVWTVNIVKAQNKAAKIGKNVDLEMMMVM